LELFEVQLHHLTPNSIVNLSKFVWACRTFGAEPDLDCFCKYYELHNQGPKKVLIGAEERLMDGQYARCTFHPRRALGGHTKVELSYAQRNRWDDDWNRHWFYIRTVGLKRKDKDGKEDLVRSLMGTFKPKSIIPPVKTSLQVACEKAFDLASRVCSGRDLVEEFLAAGIYPLGRDTWTDFTIEKMELRYLDEGVHMPFPRFGLSRPKSENDGKFVRRIEEEANKILGDYSDKEHAARVAVLGTCPRLNRVFEEMKVTYSERPVPEKFWLREQAACLWKENTSGTSGGSKRKDLPRKSVAYRKRVKSLDAGQHEAKYLSPTLSPVAELAKDGEAEDTDLCSGGDSLDKNVAGLVRECRLPSVFDDDVEDMELIDDDDSGLVTSTLQGAIAEEKEDVDPIGDADPKIAAVASVEVAAAIDVSGAALSSPSSSRGSRAHLLAVLEGILALFLAW
jgi:hypothetical protein